MRNAGVFHGEYGAVDEWRYDLNLTDAAGNLTTKQTVSVAGKASITNGALINNVAKCSAPTCKASQGACPANIDPYAGVSIPVPSPPLSSCNLGSNKELRAQQFGTPDPKSRHWCNGVSFTNDALIKLNPGVYYLNRGKFDVGGAVI